MAETEVHEKLARVLVQYEGGRVQPVELRWRNRDLSVRALNARWVDRAGRPWKSFFSVTLSDSSVVVLSHAENDVVWYVESVLT